ncbi:MAG: hypothetical protein QM758_15470 [Armatimonas sp.]
MESVWEELKADHERLFRGPGKVTGGEYNKQWDAWLKRARTTLFPNDTQYWLPDDSTLWRDSAPLSIVIGGLKVVPESLLAPMLRAAVYDLDPSFNRRYIEVCLKHWGGVRVNTDLFPYTVGSNLERAGVANAFYHSLSNPRKGYLFEWTEGPTKEQIQRAHNWFLEEFVTNSDLQVRRNTISRLNLDKPEAYPESLRPLIPRAIAIARNHPDEYIRHRVEIQLGKPGPFMAKPSRGQH